MLSSLGRYLTYSVYPMNMFTACHNVLSFDMIIFQGHVFENIYFRKEWPEEYVWTRRRYNAY